MKYWTLFVLLLTPSPVFSQQLSVSTVTVERAGWGTFGVVLPQGASVGPLQVGTLPTQTDVKVKWQDGSIRHAIVTAKFTAAGTLPITQGGASAGAAVADAPAVCSAEIVIGGTGLVASPIGQSADRWLAGSHVLERRWLVGFGSHPARRLRLDERRYSDGAVRCDFSIENALNVPETKLETYDVRLKHGATVIYQRTAVTHGSFTRWRYVHWQGGQDAGATPDLATFQAAKALPVYRPINRLSRQLPPTYASGTPWANPDTGPKDPNTGKAINWDILNLGPVFYPMLGYGGRSDIGPYPDWTAQFLAFKGPAERAYMNRVAELAGSWANHITEPATDRAPTVDLKPEFWLLRHNIRPTNGTNGPANDQRGICLEWEYDWRTCAYRPETGNAHQPAFAYVPYLITGDRFYADELRTWAHDAVISWNPMLDGKPFSINDDEIRGTAWGLRDLVDAATYLPDGDSDRAYFGKAVTETLADIVADAAVPDVTGLGVMLLGRAAPSPNHAAPTTQLFLAWSIGHAMDQGIPVPLNVLDRLTRPLINLLTHPAEYPIHHVPNYRRWVLRKDGTPFKKADGSFDYKAMHDYNFTGCTLPPGALGDQSCIDPTDGHEVYGMQPWFGYHAAEVYPGLMKAVEYGVPNAKAALEALMSYTEKATWGEVLTMDWELKRRSQWAVAPFTDGPPEPKPTPTACSDGLDNDKDGKTDLADPGCSSASDTDETDPIVTPPQPPQPSVRPKVLWTQTLQFPIASSPQVYVACVDVGDGTSRLVWRLGSNSVHVETAVCK